MVGVTRLHMHEQTKATAGKKNMSDKKKGRVRSRGYSQRPRLCELLQ